MKWVARFAERLRVDGIEARTDHDEPYPAEGLPKWMVQQIEVADFLIAVCTEKYVKSARGDGGKGVGWETTLIYQQIYNSGSRNTRIIPVLPSSGSPDHIPLPLQPFRYYRPDNATDYAALRNRVLGQARLRKGLASSAPEGPLPPSIEETASPLRYRVRELPGFGNRSPRNALTLNNAGQVAGDSHLDGGMSHAFCEQLDLILPGDEFSFAYDLNDAGMIVGLSARQGGAVRAFVYRQGQMEDLSGSTGNPSVAYGINNLGAVVGSSFVDGKFDAFAITAGILTLLGSPNGSPAKRIADSGLIAGDGWLHNGGDLTHFGWGSYVNTYDLNNLDEVVGQAGRQPQEARAFLYARGDMIDLGNLGGSFSRAAGINDRSEIVGYSTNKGGEPRAFVCSCGRIMDLNSLVHAGDGWILEVASAINNRGQIAGSGRLNGQFRAFVLDPLP